MSDKACKKLFNNGVMKMAKCPLCGKESSLENLKIRFNNNTSTHSVCSECHEAINSIIRNDEKVDGALTYINKCVNTRTDDVLLQWLKYIIDSTTENSEEHTEEKSENSNEYAKESSPQKTSSSSDTTFWISSLRGVYKFVFFVIIIIGLVLCLMLSSNEMIGIGVIVFAVSILIAVMLVGFAIVFLDLARDVHRIRNILEEQRNDKE